MLREGMHGGNSLNQGKKSIKGKSTGGSERDKSRYRNRPMQGRYTLLNLVTMTRAPDT